MRCSTGRACLKEGLDARKPLGRERRLSRRALVLILRVHSGWGLENSSLTRQTGALEDGHQIAARVANSTGGA